MSFTINNIKVITKIIIFDIVMLFVSTLKKYVSKLSMSVNIINTRGYLKTLKLFFKHSKLKPNTFIPINSVPKYNINIENNM